MGGIEPYTNPLLLMRILLCFTMFFYTAAEQQQSYSSKEVVVQQQETSQTSAQPAQNQSTPLPVWKVRLEEIKAEAHQAWTRAKNFLNDYHKWLELLPPEEREGEELNKWLALVILCYIGLLANLALEFFNPSLGDVAFTLVSWVWACLSPFVLTLLIYQLALLVLVTILAWTLVGIRTAIWLRENWAVLLAYCLRKVANLYNGDQCCICMERFLLGQEIAELGCKHIFHRSCIKTWIVESNNTCPLCREEVDLSKWEPVLKKEKEEAGQQQQGSG